MSFRKSLPLGNAAPQVQGRSRRARCYGTKQDVSKGLSVLEWTGSLVPQSALVKGAKLGWRTLWLAFMRELAPQDKSGAYQRPAYSSDGWISGDPASEFPMISGRYHLYVGNACPWCHRCLLVLALTGLTGHVVHLNPRSPSLGPDSTSSDGIAIPQTVTEATDDAERASRGGWVFDSPEPLFGKSDLREVYDALSPGYRGRCTAPLLVDKATRRIVSNESADIVRMLGEAAGCIDGTTGVVLCPGERKAEIEEVNRWIYEGINNAVYRSGFATTQAAYDAAQRDLWPSLDRAEALLSSSRFLLGDKVTEADVRLFPTIIRFDSAYATLFRCSRRRIAGGYPNLQRWLREMHGLRMPGCGTGVKETIDVGRARESYFGQLFPLNPSGIVAEGPSLAEILGCGPDGDPAAFWVPQNVEDVAYVRRGGGDEAQ